MASPLLRLPILLLSLVAAGCLTAEQRMATKVDGMMDAQQFDGALRYLEGYLSRHNKSVNGWRYRVLIRLEQGERAQAAKEYAALEAALSRHEPAVLREVVLGGGGNWLLSDYRALARCGAGGVVDARFFVDLLEPKHLSEGSMSKVEVAEDAITAVLDALPGRLPAAQTWPIVAAHAEGGPERRAKATQAAARHLQAGGLSETQIGEALDLLARAAASREEFLREIALLGSLLLPVDIGGVAFSTNVLDSFLAGGDRERAISLFLLGPRGAGPREWPEAALTRWAETAIEPLRLLAVAVLAAQAGTTSPARMKLLERGAADDEIAVRLAAAAAGPLAPGWANPPNAKDLYTALTVDQRRHFGPVFIRNQGPEAGLWAAAVLSDTDAVAAEAGALALALPLDATDPGVVLALSAAMSSPESTTRAASARAAVVRGVEALANPVGALLARGDERATELVLRTLRDNGDGRWEAAVRIGLLSDVPTTRELAVDAAVASCDPTRVDQMFALLGDADPHVAIRAASALYLLIGSAK